ncbi:MAG TPA: IPT/TIG domain-containing protein [Bryobacteraceae bacterium]|nr:IPT/TIG domain-containing protein [Bryobacteraceae bacterium]
MLGRHSGITDSSASHWRPGTHGLFRLLAVFALACLAAWAQNTPTVTAVQNLFDYSTNLCPGVLVVVYGTNFGTTVSAVTITVGGKTGYILPGGAATTELLAQIPFEVSPGPTTLTVSVNGAPSAAFPITLAATAPAFHTVDGSGSGPGVFDSAALALLTSASPAKPGDTVVVLVTGLGATNPPTATGASPKAGNVPVATPTITVGGQPAMIKAVASTQYAGSFQINFVVPDGLQGNAPIVLTTGGNSSSAQNPKNPITIPLFGISYIENNASFGSPGTTTPGTIVSLFGNGFGTTSQTVGFPATTFQNISVTFNGTPAPLFHLVNTAPSPGKPPFSIGASQIDLLVPYELPYTGTVKVAVSTGTQTSPDYSLTMAAATPGMYYIQDPSTATRFNIIAQFNNTAWLDMPASMATALMIPGSCAANTISPLSLCGQPAHPGDVLVLYGTGLGLATPNGDPNGKPLTTGNVAPADGSVLYETVVTPTITVGGFPAKVLFSGITPGFTGEYQIDFQVPDGVTGDDVPVVFSMGSSPIDTRTMSIQPATTT